MRLVRWRPQTGMVAPLHDEFEEMFDSFFGIGGRRSDLQTFDWVPRVNVEELEDKFEITVEIPGMKKDEIAIELQENVLTIKGEKKYEKQEKDRTYTICERSCGTFRRAFTLPENVTGDGIEAAYTDGVLTISVPKAEPVKPKEIKVEVK